MIDVIIKSDQSGIGKTTVAGIIKSVLRYYGYEVVLNPIPFEGIPPGTQEWASWVAQEKKQINAVGQLWALRYPRSYPKSAVRLEVHG